MRKLIEGAGKLGIELNVAQVEQFKLYYQELIEWNRKFNLTTITDYQEVQLKHFLDSITIMSVLTEEEVRKPDFSIIDIGTGAGFPGVPLKILFSKSRLVLLDSRAKKVAFLRHITQKLELESVEVIHGRAEEIARLPLYREQFALAISRAVAQLSTLVELALPFCRVGGKFVAWKKGEISQEIDKAIKAVELLGGKLNQTKNLEIEGLSERYLVIVDKISPTSDKYPRRSGIPKRRSI